MANYLIGLDFGTSQTKVCLLNSDSNVREFLKFDNEKYFLPSLITKKEDNTFSYGDETVNGTKYRYFKMAAAEDEELVKVTNEDLKGHLPVGNIDDFRKYSTNNEVKPEIFVVLYLTFIYLFIKKKKYTKKTTGIGGLLERFIGNTQVIENAYAINLGIPTEWNNPAHIKRKIKFQTLLLTSAQLADNFENLDAFLLAKDTELLSKISKINENHLNELVDKKTNEIGELINSWLISKKLAVFPESAAGINYLLKTKRLDDGCFATLDIGAGTSDIAIFEVKKNKLSRYFCSESTEIASNDFYREYAKQLYPEDSITFDIIERVEKIIKSNHKINDNFYINARNNVKGYLNSKGIEFSIRKTFYRKYFINLPNVSSDSISRLNEKPIIVFGGGANLKGFCSGNYCFYKGNNPFGNQDGVFSAKPITDFVQQVDIADDNNEIQNYTNLLVLALGLTYGEQNGNYIPFTFPQEDIEEVITSTIKADRYFYYDIQDAVYK